jgi:THO complex subunit 1
MPASKGKALPLLRTINAFLRFLPRTPADLIFRGRVHQFASSVISVADKSAINMRGDYNDVKTTWEEGAPEGPVGTSEDEVVKAAEEVEEAGAAGDENGDGSGDVQMGEEVKEESKDVQASASGETSTGEPLSTESPCRVKPGSLSVAETPKPAEPDFYSTLWSLQQYFASPPTLDGPPTGDPPHTPFHDFKTKSDFVLPRLFEQTRRENEDTEMVGSKRKRDVDDGGFFHPRYLTGKRLLEHEVGPSLDLGLSPNSPGGSWTVVCGNDDG